MPSSRPPTGQPPSGDTVRTLLLRAFGTRVRDARKGRELSQEELAERAGVHRTYVGAVERGERNVTLLTITRLAQALDVPVSDLLRPRE